jgi:hypothetical protein
VACVEPGGVQMRPAELAAGKAIRRTRFHSLGFARRGLRVGGAWPLPSGWAVRHCSTQSSMTAAPGETCAWISAMVSGSGRADGPLASMAIRPCSASRAREIPRIRGALGPYLLGDADRDHDLQAVIVPVISRHGRVAVVAAGRAATSRSRQVVRSRPRSRAPSVLRTSDSLSGPCPGAFRESIPRLPPGISPGREPSPVVAHTRTNREIGSGVGASPDRTGNRRHQSSIRRGPIL